jgi:hypothetical protein
LRDDGRVTRAADSDPRPNLADPRAATASVANHYQPAYQAAIYAALSKPQLIEDPAWRAALPPGIAQVLPPPAK